MRVLTGVLLVLLVTLPSIAVCANFVNAPLVGMGELLDNVGRLMAIGISPDGRILASVSDDSTVRLWDIATGHEIANLEGHSDAVESVALLTSKRAVHSAAPSK